MKKVLLVIAAILLMGNAFSQDMNRFLPPSVRQQLRDIERQARQPLVPLYLNTDKTHVRPVPSELMAVSNIKAISKLKDYILVSSVDSAIAEKYHLTFPLNTSLKQPSCCLQEKYSKQISKKFWFGCYVFDGENINIKLKLE